MAEQTDPRQTRRALLQAANERRERLRAADQDHFERTRHSFIYAGAELGYIKPTAETEERLRPDPIARLVANETLTREHGKAAVEIREIFERIGGALFGRASDLAERSRGARREPSDRISTLHARLYLPWARHLGGWPTGLVEAIPGRCPPALEVAIECGVFGVAPRAVDRRERWGSDTAAALLRYALMVYCDLAGWDRARAQIAAIEDVYRARGVAGVRTLIFPPVKPTLTGAGISS